MSRQTKKLVLVVDDQPDSLELFSLLLHTFLPEIEVLTELSGESGLRTARARHPDLVVLDVKMPGMDGYEVCRRLKSDPELADIPVLMVSGVLTSARHRAEGFNTGAEGYLCKPFDAQEFVAQISSLLRLKQQGDALRAREHQLESELARRLLDIREREALYRTLVEALPVMVLIVAEGVIHFANTAAARGLGANRAEDLHHRRFDDIEVVEGSSNADAEETPSQNNRSSYKATWRRLDGQVISVEVFRRPITVEDRPAEQVLGIDITAREAAEHRLRETEERYRTLVEQLPAITYLLRLSSPPRFEYLSPQVETILGGRLAEWMTNYDQWVAHIHPADREQVVRAMGMSRENRAIEYRMRGKDGREVWLRDHSRLLAPAGQAPVIHGVLIDITDRKQAEERLQQKEEQLRHIQKMEALGRLAGGIAHDFNNLLTSILGYGHLLLEKSNLPTEAREDLLEIIHAGERAEELTRRLLTFSRKQIMQKAPISINDVVQGMEKLLHRSLGPDIELVLALDEEAGFIQGDAAQIEQVLMNLAANARSAMPRGGRLVISTRSVILDEEICRSREELTPGPYLCLEVSDTGCGMTPEVRERAFEPFFTTKKPGEGTGIGLATVYGIVRGHNGFIELESEVGRGTRFRMYFPRVEEIAARPLPPIEEDVPHGSETILLVEDEEAVRKLVNRMLTSLGYRVLEASNSGEALLIFERQESQVDLVLTDVIMPHVNGIEMAARLRRLRPDVRVLFMTGYMQRLSETLSEGEEASVLLKPFTRAELARRVRQALDAQPLRRSPGEEASPS